MKNIVALVLGGGRGTRLQPLTSYRSKPAVPLAGKYRLIDIPLSNCLNSGINHVYVLTQFLSVSLHRHIRGTYRFDHFSGGFVEILAAQQTMEGGTDWYEGTADAVRKNLRYLKQPWVEHVLILSGDQLYRMDFRRMLAEHKESGADVSIAGLPVPREAASGLGIMRADETGRVEGFLEKPQTDKEIEHVRTDPAWLDARGLASRGRDCVASMGIYLFNRQTILDVLEKTEYEDFGKEVFPASIRSRHVQLHLFDGYWEDIGTIRSFYDANLALAGSEPPFDLTTSTAPIYTRPRFLPSTRLDEAHVEGSLVADGCTIGGGTRIERSVVGLRCRIGKEVSVRDSVLMGADFYESPDDLAHDAAADQPPIGIGQGSHIEGAIVDKNVHIGRNVRIEPPANGPDADLGHGCHLREGIVVVEKGAIIPDGWKVGG